MYLTVIYGINLALVVPVCLHCGEIGADGALFCAKCGYTLPQVQESPGSPQLPSPPPPPSPTGSGYLPFPGSPSANSPAAYPTSGGPTGTPTGPMPPPPSGKYCVRCRTIISKAAVYCPVCQQPQTP
jgi:RNA polymerase subunit RPABC4/transcription elongation factor Spt4